MTLIIVVILVAVLLVVAIGVNAIQQHKEKVAQQQRTEINKHKGIIEETETLLANSEFIPISAKLVAIYRQRILYSCKSILELDAKQSDIKSKLNETQSMMQSAADLGEKANENDFRLPDNDKAIIQYIQTIKKMRVMLRAEQAKGRVDTQIFAHEDRSLASLQLRVNVDTLVKRGRAAVKNNMAGSARQYFEKAIAAIGTQNRPSEYLLNKKTELIEELKEIQDQLRNVNAEDRAKKAEEERDELDELFAPKKKW